MDNTNPIVIPVTFNPFVTLPAGLTLAQDMPLGAINAQNYALSFGNGIAVLATDAGSYVHLLFYDEFGNYTWLKSSIPMPTYNRSILVNIGNFIRFNNYTSSVYFPIPNATVNNKVPYIVYAAPTLSVCGVDLSFLTTVDRNLFAYQGFVSNSQNGGYVYAGFFNSQGVLIAGGLQGTYEGPSSTFYTPASNIDPSYHYSQPLSNGLVSGQNFDGTYWTYGLFDVNYNLGFSTCTIDFPPNLPFPGNYSGAQVLENYTESIQLINNPYREYGGYVDSYLYLWGVVNRLGYDNNLGVLCYDGKNQVLYAGNSAPFYPVAVLNKYLYVTSSSQNQVYRASLSYNPFSYNKPVPVTRSAFHLQNFSRPVSLLGKYKT